MAHFAECPIFFLLKLLHPTDYTTLQITPPYRLHLALCVLLFLNVWPPFMGQFGESIISPPHKCSFNIPTVLTVLPNVLYRAI